MGDSYEPGKWRVVTASIVSKTENWFCFIYIFFSEKFWTQKDFKQNQKSRSLWNKRICKLLAEAVLTSRTSS